MKSFTRPSRVVFAAVVQILREFYHPVPVSQGALRSGQHDATSSSSL